MYRDSFKKIPPPRRFLREKETFYSISKMNYYFVYVSLTIQLCQDKWDNGMSSAANEFPSYCKNDRVWKLIPCD